MSKKLTISAILLCAATSVAWNSHQNFQPFNQNYKAANSGTPIPLPNQENLIFQADDGANPEVGTATYTRTGAITYSLTGSRLAEVGSNLSPTTSLGTEYSGEVKNYLTWSEQFQRWTYEGTGWVGPDTITDPLSGSGADTIYGIATGDGVSQSSGYAAASTQQIFSVYARSSVGTTTVRLQLKDAGTDIAENICFLTTQWTRCEVAQWFQADALGNSVAKILVDDSTHVRVFGAQLEVFDDVERPVGTRFAVGSANPYIRTTTAARTSVGSKLTIPRSIYSQISETGTVSFALKTWRDYGDTLSSGGFTVFTSKPDGEISFDAQQNIIFRINNAEAISTDKLPPASFQRIVSVEQNQWNLWTVTWDTTEDVYRIYRNGVLMNGPGFEADEIDIGESSVLVFDGQSWNPPDATISNIAIWKVALSEEDVAVLPLVVGNKIRSSSSSGKMFEVVLGDSPNPVVGYGPYKYFSMTPVFYYDTPSTAAYAPKGTLPIGHPIGWAGGRQGMRFQCWTENLLNDSETPTFWDAVGTPDVSDETGTFGVIALGTVEGTSGEGISQTTTTPVEDVDMTFQVLVSTATGTCPGSISVSGTGGTPETETETFTATTTPKWVHVWKDFSASATGNAVVTILLTDSCAMRVGGMLLSRRDIQENNWPDNGTSPIRGAFTYAPSGSRAGPNWLEYDAKRNINYREGTYIAWHAPDFSDLDTYSSYGPSILGTGNNFELYPDQTLTGIQTFSFGGIPTLVQAYIPGDSPRWTHNGWQMFTATWDATDEPRGTKLKTYYNTTKVNDYTSTGTDVYAPTAKNFWIGGMGGTGSRWNPVSVNDCYNGLIDRVEIYGHAFTDSEVEAAYNDHAYDYAIPGATPVPTATQTPTPDPTQTPAPTATPSPTPTPVTYQYGYPGCGSCDSEPDVAFQWKFDESGVPMTDEVASATITGESGDPEYQQSQSGQWANFSCVKYDGNDYNSKDPFTSMTIEGQAVFEIVASVNADAGSYAPIFNTGGPTYGVPGFLIYAFYDYGTSDDFRMEFRSNDGVMLYSACDAFPSGNAKDGNLHKYRIVFDLIDDDTISLVVDGASRCSIDASTLHGKSITTSFLYVGYSPGDNDLKGQVCEWRVTVGNKTNCSVSGGDCE